MNEYLPLVLTGIGIIVSILYLANIIINLNKTHQKQLEANQIQMLMQIYNESYNNDSFIDAYVRLADFTTNSYDEYLKLMEDEENKKASTKVAMRARSCVYLDLTVWRIKCARALVCSFYIIFCARTSYTSFS